MLQTGGVARLVRDGVALAFDESGAGSPPLLLVHGVACHRGFWAPQLRHFAERHRVVVPDLRGHGDSDAPVQPYPMRLFADDLEWMCERLELTRPIVVGHSLGGLAALELAARYQSCPSAVALIDSVLLPRGNRVGAVRDLVTSLRGDAPEQALREYFEAFFEPCDTPARNAWILDEAVKTPPHVTSSVWEQSLTSWDDTDALRRCRAPLLYLDAGTENADLAAAARLQPGLMVGRTVGSGHFSPLEVPDQVNAMLARFIALAG